MMETATLPVIPEAETNEDENTSRPGNVTIGLEDVNVEQTASFETPRNRRASLIDGHSRWGQSRRQLLRESITTDLQGGKEVLVEEVTHARSAMDPMQRLAGQFFGISTTNHDEEEDIETETTNHKQYRLTSRQTEKKWSLWQKITGIGPDEEGCDQSNAAGAGYLTMYLRWTFQTSFCLLFFSSFLAFGGLCFFFAALIYAAGKSQPQCLNVGGKNFTAAGEHFGAAFGLSWQTLSTVGYGIVYPDTGTMCMGVNLLCTIEAFVGVLFVGFMAAILFGKVGRTQSFATVDFSDPIVVRYGTGLMEDEVSVSNMEGCPFPILEFRCLNHMHSERGGEILNATVNVVAAVLASKASGSVRSAVSPRAHRKLIRIMPKQVTDIGKAGGKFVADTAQKVSTAAGNVVPKQVAHIGKAGGRLVTGTAEKVGNVAGKAVPKPIEAMGKEFGGFMAGTAQKVGAVAGKTVTAAGQATGMFRDSTEATKGYDPDESNPSVKTWSLRDENSLERGLGATDLYAASIIEATRENQVLDEGSELVPQRIFCRLEVDTPAHPLFKRVWNFRHTLDQNSPLLSQKAKQLIAESNGLWPRELNNCQVIRKNLHFHEIIVNLSGTGNATGSSVYAQKVYSFDDVYIGYTFVSALFRRRDGKISVDKHLLNDVVEQKGGGGEPFVNVPQGWHASDVVDQVFKMTNDVRKEAQDKVATTTEKMHDMAKDVVLQTAEKVTESGAQFTYGKKDA